MSDYLIGSDVLGSDCCAPCVRRREPVVEDVLGEVLGYIQSGFESWQENRTSRMRGQMMDKMRAAGLLAPDPIDEAMASGNILGHYIGPWWGRDYEDAVTNQEIVGDASPAFGPFWTRGFDPFYEIDLSDVEPREDEYFLRSANGNIQKVIMGLLGEGV